EGGGGGLRVMSVDANGPGAAANIHQGDVLVSWDGMRIGKLRPLLRSLGPDSIGKQLAIELRRGGEPHQTGSQIGGRPVALTDRARGLRYRMPPSRPTPPFPGPIPPPLPISRGAQLVDQA